MKGPDRVRAALEAAGLECTIHTLPDSTRTAVEAAAAVGCSVAEIAKTLVFRAGDRAVAAIMSGDNRLDPGKLAAAFGEQVGRADADFVRAATGFAIGGVPPLGYTTPVRDVYGRGASEMVVGRLLRELLHRDEYVLQTKVAMPAGPGANQGGLSRKHIMEGVDASLRRLGHDYVDVLVVHRHPHRVPGHRAVPIEETLEALHDVVWPANTAPRVPRCALPGCSASPESPLPWSASRGWRRSKTWSPAPPLR